MQSSQIAAYYTLPEAYEENGSLRQKERSITVEVERYKTVNFWFSVLEKYGYAAFSLIKTVKVGKYGAFYDFVASVPEVNQLIQVNIVGTNFRVSRVSVKKSQENQSHEATFLMYQSKQANPSSNRLYELLKIMSCIQYNLFNKISPNAQNQLVFSYSPLSTKATNTELKAYKEPFIKFNMTIEKPQVVSAKGAFDMNTKFVAYEKRQTKKKGIVPCDTEFVPIEKTITMDTLTSEITELSIAMNANIDMSNVHIPLSRVGYVSFKALVRSLVYFKNLHPPQTNVTIDRKSEMFNDLMTMSRTANDDYADTDDEGDEGDTNIVYNGVSKRVVAFDSRDSALNALDDFQ